MTPQPERDAHHAGRAASGRPQEQPQAHPARLLTPSVLAHPDITKNWPPPPPPPPHKQSAGPFAAADYTFTLDTMTVMSLCSALRDDQDQIVASVTVNDEPPQVATYPKPGVGAGLHNLGFVLPTIHAASPTDKIVFNYTIVNVAPAQGGTVVTVLETILKAAAQSAVSTEINQALKGLLNSGAGVVATLATGAAEAGGGALGTLVFPVIGSAVGALVGFLIGEGFTALVAECNAVVASEQFGCTGEYLWEQTHSGNAPWTLAALTQHPGSKAKDGCTTSYYETYWTCKAS